MGMLFCCWHVLLPQNMHFRDMCKNHTKKQLKVSRCFKKLTEMRLLLIQMSTFTWAYHHRLKCWGAALRLISHVPQCVTKRRSEKKKNASDCCWVVITLPLSTACQAGGGAWALKATEKPKARGRWESQCLVELQNHLKTNCWGGGNWEAAYTIFQKRFG